MIDQVTVRNFRGLAQADLQLTEPVTLVLGANGAGKSSLAEGLRWGLTGACEWTDTAGKGAGVLIGHGGPTATVGVVGAACGVIERSLNAKGSTVLCGDRTGSEAQAAIDAALPGKDLLKAMLRSDGFIGLPGKAQQDLLFALSGGEVDATWFRQHLTPEEAEVLDEALATLARGSGLADKLHGIAYDLRKDVNRDVKTLEAQVGGSETQETVDVAPLEAALAQLRKREGKLREQIGAGAAAKQAQEQAAAREQQAGAEVKRITAALAALGEEPAEVTEDEIAEAAEALKAAQAAYSAAVNDAAEANASRSTLQEQLDQFVALKDQCVLGGLTCPVGATERGAVIKRTQASIDRLEAVGKESQDAMREAEQAHNAAGDELDRLRLGRQAFLTHQDRSEELQEQLAAAKDRQIDALHAYQQSGAPNVTSLQEDLAGLKARIEAAQTELNTALEINRSVERARDDQTELASLKAEQSLLDGLVKKLSQDGLPAQAMRETIGTVIDAINDVLGEFTDFQIAAEPGKEFQLLVSDGDGILYPVRCLSESEKLRVGAAIQVAFARLTGFGFVIVDAADRLDGTNRPALLKMLLESGVKSLVLATPANGRIPQAPGLAVYRIENGVLAAAEVVAA